MKVNANFLFVVESDLSKIKEWREEILKTGKSKQYFRKTIKEWIGKLFDFGYAKHICILFNNDMFEYDPTGYHRHKNVGRQEMYDFDPFHRYHIWIPIENTFFKDKDFLAEDYIEELIQKNGQWTAKKYNIITHNCIHFVQACLAYAEVKHINLKKEGEKRRKNLFQIKGKRKKKKAKEKKKDKINHFNYFTNITLSYFD